MSHLHNVFLEILQAGRKINFEKCEFGRASVDFLGFRVGLGRIELRARKVEAILNFPQPSFNKMLVKWNGLASYFHKFLPNYAKISSSLTDMLRKKSNFRRSEEAEKAFDEIKRLIASHPILKTPDFHLPFFLACDASDKSIAAIPGDEKFRAPYLLHEPKAE